MQLLVRFPSWLILVGIFQDTVAVCGGKAAEDGQFKYIAAIEIGQIICGGAIIDERHILTAAHCVYAAELKDIVITVGTINIYDASGQKRGVEQKHIPPDYKHPVRIPVNRKGYLRLLQCVLKQDYVEILPENDIAVLTLDEPLELEGYINKVQLPETDELPLCTPCEFAGWGMTKLKGKDSQVLLWNTIGIMSPDEYRNKPNYRSNEFLAIDENFCTAPLPGDSGSPLVCNDIIVGIISSGKLTPKLPTIFTKVFSFITFINEARGKDNVST